ncbi:8-oxo-dGTP pyrophosphatase MutT, NUDIX family [Fontimonas thermophila]|uniref:8-oxo-dGTP pyrophosphatase MutT, NUDIX family n=1 Tax=Fontimonas thermophila TaxID=1076937 RepID=A0A1I2HW71_9GAMM|nr:CoA pyrophosphatase [Fontimonas thermophila]SFF33788.1 8-oxo-dGTP pyrophosphatase MutT, NUDIX family [Fontimonas thermophila]
MNAESPVTEMTEWEQRLRCALAGTSLAPPRPMVDLALPFKAQKLLEPLLGTRLRAAAVLVPVIRRGDDASMLFTVRAGHLRSHSGQISFPGGGCDAADGNAVDTALREAREEIGLDPACVEVIGFLDDYPTLSRYRVTPVVGLIEGEPHLSIDQNEVAEVFEVPLAFVFDSRNFKRTRLSREGIHLPVLELNWRQHRIWGATAGMLWNLVQKVGAA